MGFVAYFLQPALNAHDVMAFASAETSPGGRLQMGRRHEKRERVMTTGDKKAIGWTVGITGALVLVVVIAYALGLFPQA